jgi:hypothetical protein
MTPTVTATISSDDDEYMSNIDEAESDQHRCERQLQVDGKIINDPYRRNSEIGNNKLLYKLIGGITLNNNNNGDGKDGAVGGEGGV